PRTREGRIGPTAQKSEEREERSEERETPLRLPGMGLHYGMPALVWYAGHIGRVGEGIRKGCPNGCWRRGMKAVCAVGLFPQFLTAPDATLGAGLVIPTDGLIVYNRI
ncbi:MAG: hypothetical protein OXK78_10020, partial [Caldilineaceae bacterium]|nr:hypothetical protein [Caldilineaceae bacterium]